jgi:glycosyltransferase involved in cell wall biosynthesis
MRLLVLTHYFNEHRSGTESIAYELAKRLSARGWEVTWVASFSGPREGDDSLRRIEIPSWDGLETWLGISYPIWGPLSLLRVVFAVARSEVVHLHDCLFLGNLVAFLSAKALGRPVIVTQHIGAIPFSRLWMRRLHHGANRFLGSLILGGSDRVVFYSHRVAQYFRTLIPRLTEDRLHFEWCGRHSFPPSL